MTDLKELKQKAYDANMKLSASGLVMGTFGNVSGIQRDDGIIAIKPSCIPYEDCKPEDMFLVTLEGEKTYH